VDFSVLEQLELCTYEGESLSLEDAQRFVMDQCRIVVPSANGQADNTLWEISDDGAAALAEATHDQTVLRRLVCSTVLWHNQDKMQVSCCIILK
jgi:hypothetical protein